MEKSSFSRLQRFQPEPHNVRETDAIFSIATTSAARYVSDSSADNTTRLDESLNELITYVSNVNRVTRLTLKNRLLREFLTYTPIILGANTTSITTRSKFYRLLFNLAHHNIPLRRFMAGELRLLGAVVSCLKTSLREQLGPQNMIDILRLLQVLSYEKNVPLEHWANELISFLIGEVICDPEPEWMPYCIAILCNLASASKSACKRIKISSSYRKFSRQLMKLLQHEARIIVVSSLVLIGYLDEKVRDMVYCSENVHDTFMCTFNVLTIGDDECMMTRQIASDLLRRLVVSESTTPPYVSTLASTGKNVLNYGFFTGSVQQTAKLLVTLDPRTEESAKVYDLLLAFCSLRVLRSPVCQAIIRCSPTESQLTTPLMAIAETAALSFDDSINEDVPLKALKMLTFLIKEVIEPHERLIPDIPVEQIIDLIANCVRISIDIESEKVISEFQRLKYGLRLAGVCGRDEDCRNYLLTVCSATLCHQIANWQFLQNPVVPHLTKPARDRSENLGDWTMHGIEIILELCRLLAVLKDHSKVHKDQYWQLLKDERIIPFLAYAVSYGDQETVQQAFLTYSHCAQVPAFPSHMLAEMVASCQNATISAEKSNGIFKKEPTDPDEKSPKALDEQLQKVSIEGHLKDTKTSELFAAYEQKIQILQTRERNLENLVRAKDEALAQSESLRNGAYRLSETETSKTRQELETLREQNKQLTEYISTSKSECERLKDELIDARKSVEAFSKSRGELETSLSTAIAENGRLKIEIEAVTSRSLQTAHTSQMEVSRLNAELAQSVARVELFLKESKEVRQLFDEKAVECEALKEHLNQIEAQMATLTKELEYSKLQTSVAQQTISEKENELAVAEKHIKLCEDKLTEKEHQLKMVEAEANSLRANLESSQQNLQKLERLREAMLSLASSNS
uniref:CIP2A N-terminal domain-containing protein n=1 Tax=Caenorhabditis japonica TaxID=281687 RepID=A0A8R1HTY5_CAEJA